MNWVVRPAVISSQACAANCDYCMVYTNPCPTNHPTCKEVHICIVCALFGVD